MNQTLNVTNIEVSRGIDGRVRIRWTSTDEDWISVSFDEPIRRWLIVQLEKHGPDPDPDPQNAEATK